MPADSDAETAFAALRKCGFKVNAAWHDAHRIAQAHEGERFFDAIHAALHRIEGDPGNAAYWDRRAGTDLGKNGPAAELAALENLAQQD